MSISQQYLLRIVVLVQVLGGLSVLLDERLCNSVECSVEYNVRSLDIVQCLPQAPVSTVFLILCEDAYLDSQLSERGDTSSDDNELSFVRYIFRNRPTASELCDMTPDRLRGHSWKRILLWWVA